MSNPLKDINDAGIVKGLAQFGIVAREDVDVLLSKSPDTFNLFLIALKELQEDEFTSWDYKMSFFQLAGRIQWMIPFMAKLIVHKASMACLTANGTRSVARRT